MFSDGKFSITSSPVGPIPVNAFYPCSLSDVLVSKPTFRVFLSPTRSTPTFHTRHKTTDRSVYDEVRSVLPKPEIDDLPPEILLVNEIGDIMEGSITTPYFFHNDKWVTPAQSCGGNLGTTRRWALEKQLCEEGFVSMRSLQVSALGEKVILSNGVRGFGWGRVEPLPNS